MEVIGKLSDCSSDHRVAIESSAGYSVASCSPAEPASASPADGDFEGEVVV